jgi:hypothetical protein
MRRISAAERRESPGDPAEGFCLAGFEDACFWGDWIVPGDVVQYVEYCGWEHRECSEAERAVFVRPDR